MTVRIKCIKELITDNSKYISYCEDEEEIAQLLSLPELRLFTEGEIYDVQISDGGEWRVKDDTCGEAPYNHIVFNKRIKNNGWFDEYFIVIEEN